MYLQVKPLQSGIHNEIETQVMEKIPKLKV